VDVSDVRSPIRSVLMVCTGNICRSPAAEAVLRHRLTASGLSHIEVDSAGTGDWHSGEPSHPHSRSVGTSRGYVLEHRARTVKANDCRFDLMLAMDSGHLRWLQRQFRSHSRVQLLRGSEAGRGRAPGRVPDLDDPYGQARAVYEAMYDVIEAAMPGVVETILGSHAGGVPPA
jgi:protein-tyrosine phosphatase